MRIKPVSFGIAGAITAAILWLICSFLVLILPAMMMKMTGAMVHADLSNMNWTLTLSGVLIGLVSWSISAGATGWILAYIYNVLIKD